MTEYLKIKNWETYQHYKDRCPPWIKLHYSILSGETWVMLDDASKLLAVVCMMIASRSEEQGCVPNNPAYIKRVAYLDNVPDLKPLIDCGFLEGASGCKQMLADDTTETETEERQREATPSKYYFEGEVIKLKRKDFLAWFNAYEYLTGDMLAQIKRLDAFYAEEGVKKNWFVRCSAALKKENEKRKAQQNG